MSIHSSCFLAQPGTATNRGRLKRLKRVAKRQQQLSLSPPSLPPSPRRPAASSSTAPYTLTSLSSLLPTTLCSWDLDQLARDARDTSFCSLAQTLFLCTLISPHLPRFRVYFTDHPTRSSAPLQPIRERRTKEWPPSTPPTLPPTASTLTPVPPPPLYPPPLPQGRCSPSATLSRTRRAQEALDPATVEDRGPPLIQSMGERRGRRRGGMPLRVGW